MDIDLPALLFTTVVNHSPNPSPSPPLVLRAAAAAAAADQFEVVTRIPKQLTTVLLNYKAIFPPGPRKTTPLPKMLLLVGILKWVKRKVTT